MNPVQWITCKLNNFTLKISSWCYGKDSKTAAKLIKEEPKQDEIKV